MDVNISPDAVSMWQLVVQASFLVQLVMGLLLLASLGAWIVIFQKSALLRSVRRLADRFEDGFWSGGDLSQLHDEWSKRRTKPGGMGAIFVSGFREFSRLNQKGDIERSDMLDGVQRAMRASLNREMDGMEHRLQFLATVGSTSPYVGLFGTVWGIMNSFRALGVTQQASIASVAPGIAEALIATAMGLFAAIPAVIAYNRYATEIDRLATRYETFMEEFLSIVNRQAVVRPR
ncbi:MAG: protein TolQ [Gammaproteobacteria bacterium]|nr:protein TolQ [Gammaproteobacteria bacterium]